VSTVLWWVGKPWSFIWGPIAWPAVVVAALLFFGGLLLGMAVERRDIAWAAAYGRWVLRKLEMWLSSGPRGFGALAAMITAVNVQREVGGNLAEVLDAISHTIRERVRIKGDIRALTAYGRGAGNLLSAMPVIVTIVVYLISPDFMSQLFVHPCGWVMIGVAVVGIVAGFLIIRKIVDIDV